MSNKTNLQNLLLGGSIVTPKSGVLIQNIHTVEYKYGGEYVIGGETITYPYGYLTKPEIKSRWTTIQLEEY